MQVPNTCLACGQELHPGAWHDCPVQKVGDKPVRTPGQLNTNHNADWDLVKGKSALSTQEGGNHYKDMVIQPVEFITKNLIPYLEGNVIKYVCRHRRKNGIEDLKKAQHYIALILELEYGEKP